MALLENWLKKLHMLGPKCVTSIKLFTRYRLTQSIYDLKHLFSVI